MCEFERVLRAEACLLLSVHEFEAHISLQWPHACLHSPAHAQVSRFILCASQSCHAYSHSSQVGRYLADVPDGHTPALRLLMPFMLSLDTHKQPSSCENNNSSSSRVHVDSASSNGQAATACEKMEVDTEALQSEEEAGAVRFLLPGLLQVRICVCVCVCALCHLKTPLSVCISSANNALLPKSLTLIHTGHLHSLSRRNGPPHPHHLLSLSPLSPGHHPHPRLPARCVCKPSAAKHSFTTCNTVSVLSTTSSKPSCFTRTASTVAQAV